MDYSIMTIGKLNKLQTESSFIKDQQNHLKCHLSTLHFVSISKDPLTSFLFADDSHLMQRTDSLEKTLILETLRAVREGDSGG